MLKMPVLKRWWKLLIILIVVIAVLAWLAFTQLSPGLTAVKDQAYPAIKVGSTTTQQLDQQLGSAYTSYTQNEYHIKSQKSPRSPYKPDLFYIKDGVVVMKEEWFEPTVYYYAEKDLVAKYGQPTTTLYDTRPLDMVTKALLYPSRGLAAFVYEDSQALTHIQYFEPMSLDEYLKTWGQNLGQKKDIKPFKMESN
jgi:hypothetical protein